jgi:hypothetical protein
LDWAVLGLLKELLVYPKFNSFTLLHHEGRIKDSVYLITYPAAYPVVVFRLMFCWVSFFLNCCWLQV